MTVKAQLILETYPSNGSPFDGLSSLYCYIKENGTVIADSSALSGRTVLVCGIAPLYEHKISPLNTNIIFTTFESDQLPDEWIRAINKYDYCIVPHDEVKKVFIVAGVNIPISVIHQGYRRYKRKTVYSTSVKHFNIGFLGIPVNRKNLLKLYNACVILKNTDIPVLQLHVHVSTFYDWLDARPFEVMKNDPMVKWTTGKYTDAQIADWYYMQSCYIFPSSGEGWSFTPRESMYLGIPTIITNIPVHKELTQSGFYKVIETTGMEPANFDGNVYGHWNYVEVEQIREAILDVYQRHTYFVFLASQGAQWIADKWKNEEIAVQINTLIGSTFDIRAI